HLASLIKNVTQYNVVSSLQYCIERLGVWKTRLAAHQQTNEVTMNDHVQSAKSAPFFNPLSPDFIRNPYPHYERMRTTDPVHLTPLGMFVASRHAAASLVMRDKRFGKD